MATILKQYVRDKKGNPRGLVLAVVEPGPNLVKLGWSFCNTKKDKFDRKLAETIALGRTETGTGHSTPLAVKKEFAYFQKRLLRFLKAYTVIAI